jgi:DNA-binding GntR family transcriptional regulator
LAAPPQVTETTAPPLLREQAYGDIKRRLFTGELRPGQFVSQRELAELTGLPLAPVRDAIRRLEAEALVRVIPQRGIAITALDVDVVREAFELRRALESYAARRFCERGPVDLVVELGREMRRVAEAARHSFTSEIAEAALEVDWRLHDTIVAALDNRLYFEVHRVTFEKIRLLRANRAFTRERLAEALVEHEAIIAALVGRDADAAAAAVERHLDIALRNAIGLRA